MKKLILILATALISSIAFSQTYYIEDGNGSITLSRSNDTIIAMKSNCQLLTHNRTQIVLGVNKGYRKEYYNLDYTENGFASLTAFRLWMEIIISEDYRKEYTHSSGNLIESQYIVRTLYDTIIEGKDTLTYSLDTLLTFDHINLDR